MAPPASNQIIITRFTLRGSKWPNPQITVIFCRTGQELQATQQNMNNGMYPTIAQGGRAFITPSKNMILGRRQRKKHANAQNVIIPTYTLYLQVMT